MKAHLRTQDEAALLSPGSMVDNEKGRWQERCWVLTRTQTGLPVQVGGLVMQQVLTSPSEVSLRSP